MFLYYGTEKVLAIFDRKYQASYLKMPIITQMFKTEQFFYLSGGIHRIMHVYLAICSLHTIIDNITLILDARHAINFTILKLECLFLLRDISIIKL